MSTCQPLEPVTLHAERGCAGVIQDLGWGGYPRLSRWVQHNLKGPYKREAGGSESIVVDAEAKGPPANECRRPWPLEAENGKQQIPPEGSGTNAALQTLTSDL